MRRGVSLYAATCIFTLLIVHCHAKVVPYLPPGFSFNYDGPQQTVALPVTAQCETIRLKWARGKAKGPAPIAPYFLQVFSSSSASPYIVPAGPGPSFEWQVPFAPQTQYQICMYDNFGVSGGCQAMRTMIASPTNVTSCQNVTSLPSLPVSTSLDDPSRPVTQLPVISQCEVFSVSATTGQPPYTLTIAPSRHPPVNISSSSPQIDWTVALPEGFPFFASVTSADGLFWSRGPLYVDGTGSTDCLAPGSIPKQMFTVSTVGSTLGSFVVGGIIGALGMFLFARFRGGNRPAARSLPIISKPTLIPELSHNYEPPTRPVQPSIQYPPPSMEPDPLSVPTTPERSNFLEQDPFAHQAPRSQHGGDPFSSPSSRGRDSLPASSIVPFTDTTPTPTSSHFPLDVKSRRSTLQHSRSPSRTPSLRSYTTFASTSDFNQSSYAPSSHNSLAPLMPSNVSTRSSRVSRLGRAPTYVRRAPTTTTLRSHHDRSVAEVLMDDSSMIGSGDLPPSYNRTPADQEISITGGAL